MLFFIVMGFIFVSNCGYGLIGDSSFLLSEYPSPHFIEDVKVQVVNGSTDVHFDDDSEVRLKLEFCDGLKMAEDCVFLVEGLWDLLSCKREWESKVKALNKEVQNSRFAMPKSKVKELSNKLHSKINTCQKNAFFLSISEGVFCAKSELLKMSRYVFEIYKCSELLL